ncbi:nSTAND1 domain-containing NTPase [Ornithinimicrobium sediminis]|uniref:nSTAND1 domain-containing NTPase n=1 Tax=Ornithinimicrobium sediminis TaxID=2904603 RepID=UPI001E528CD5|nr:BTAD domain-containing putative transcriptional regulator [Ornithinimicrobium sediminis]MCE0487258.1 winged helix-turn-helix domain-containing protein [Ornithinimicrobium sediminis]
MDIRVLGGVRLGDQPAGLGPRDRVVLAALVVRLGEVVTSDALAEALWDGDPPPSWSKVVQGCVVRLRRELGRDAIETQGHGYRLQVPSEAVDVARFERLVGRARELLSLGEPDRAAYSVDEALSLWAGEPWPELETWEPARVEAERLSEVRLSAEELRLEAALGTGRGEEALAEAQARVSQAPLREHRWTLWALALYQAGRQGDALEALRRARRVLADELGVDPGPELVATEQAILRQDESLTVPETPVSTSACPYQGLVPYDVDDAESFFGRARQIEEGLDRLAGSGVLAVVGPSGSGKSSLVRAGIAAAVQRTGKGVVVITPGARPLDVWTQVPTEGDAVLVVDQVEEVVTLCDDEQERTAFLRAVADYADRAHVVLALRADKLGEFGPHPEFTRILERGFYLLAGLDADGLREAIEAPARQAGLLFEAGLVDLLVREVEGEPGSLPLLSHALRQTWTRREGSTLTVAGYQSTGGIRGAVAQTADAVYEQMPAGQHRVLRDLLLRLVTPTPEGEAVRSRVPRRSVATDAAHEEMIETLVQARLVTSDDGVVEIAHESLARAWPRLREWLVDDVEGHRIWRHLTASAEAWDAMGRPSSELYRGARLARALEWREQSATDLNATEREFLEASETSYRSAVQKERDEAQRQTQVNRRLRALVAGVAALALVAVVVGAFAFRQADRADAQATVAEAEALRARAHELAASAVGELDRDPGLAALLAVSAATTAPMSVETTRVLHQVWAAGDTVARHTLPWDGPSGLALHPDGDLLAMSGAWFDDGAKSLEVIDPLTGERVWSYEVPTGPGHDAAYLVHPSFSPDGELVAGGVLWEPHQGDRAGWDRGTDEEPPSGLLGGYLWDAETGDVVDRLDLGPCGGVVVAVTDTTLLARAPHDGGNNGCASYWSETRGADPILVDRESGEQTVLGEPMHWAEAAALSEDGRTAAYGTWDAPGFVVVDVVTGEQLLRGDTPSPQVWAMAADGSFVVVASEPMEVWDVESGELLATYNGHNGPVGAARLVPGSETMVTSGFDGTIRQWDVRTGREVQVVQGAGGGAVATSRAGVFAVAREGGGVHVVDTTLRGELGEVETCPGFLLADTLKASTAAGLLTFTLICEGADTMTTFGHAVATGERTFEVAGHMAQDVALSPDGSRWVRQDGTGVNYPGGPEPFGVGLVVRDTRTGEVVTELEGTCPYWLFPSSGAALGSNLGLCVTFPGRPFAAYAWQTDWSPDGRYIAVAINQSGVAVWDATTGELVHAGYPVEPDTRGQTVDLAQTSHDVLFTPDSSELVVSLRDGQVLLLDTATWESDASVQVENDEVGLAGWSADGELIAMGRMMSNNVGATLHWLDPLTLEVTRTVRNVHDGSLRSGSVDPGGTRLATAGLDGRVRVWDLTSGALVHEAPFGDVHFQALAWVGEDAVAVARREGGVIILEVDPDRLLDRVRTSLTRGYTRSECTTYGFDNTCPVLAELRGPQPGDDDPVTVAGTFRLSWAVEDLHGAYVDGVGQALAVGKDDWAAEEVLARAEEMAGDYTLTFTGVRYELSRSGAVEPDCVGSLSVRDDILRLTAERGSVCSPYTLFEASYRLDGDQLHLSPDGFVGPWWERLTWTSRPLERVDG